MNFKVPKTRFFGFRGLENGRVGGSADWGSRGVGCIGFYLHPGIYELSSILDRVMGRLVPFFAKRDSTKSCEIRKFGFAKLLPTQLNCKNTLYHGKTIRFLSFGRFRVDLGAYT